VIDLATQQPIAPLPDTPLGRGLAAIAQADRGFSPDGFLGGASSAFEMIVRAYTGDDADTLRSLLSDDVYRNFSGAIDARRQAGHRLETELMGLRGAELIEADLAGSIARVTVRFTSEQVNTLKDAEGRVMEGDPNRITEVIDEWTFQRDLRSADPNWLLVATRSPSA
jgi:predicted lipid-binding transport protein (Tim44 family)